MTRTQNKQLNPSSFGVYNRVFAQKYGLNAAILVEHLIYKQEYFRHTKRLSKDGMFYNSHVDIQRDTTLSHYKQRNATRLLESLNIVHHKERYTLDNRTISVWKVDIDTYRMVTRKVQDTLKKLEGHRQIFEGHRQETKGTPSRNLTVTLKKLHTTNNNTDNETDNKTEKNTDNKLRHAKEEVTSYAQKTCISPYNPFKELVDRLNEEIGGGNPSALEERGGDVGCCKDGTCRAHTPPPPPQDQHVGLMERGDE